MSASSALEQKPDSLLLLVEPRLDKAGAGDIAVSLATRCAALRWKASVALSSRRSRKSRRAVAAIFRRPGYEAVRSLSRTSTLAEAVAPRAMPSR